MATLRDNVSAVPNLDSGGWRQVFTAADADCLLSNGNLRRKITRVLAHGDQPETVISQMLRSFYSNGARCPLAWYEFDFNSHGVFALRRLGFAWNIKLARKAESAQTRKSCMVPSGSMIRKQI
jgi:hypothetical protein